MSHSLTTRLGFLTWYIDKEVVTYFISNNNNNNNHLMNSYYVPGIVLNPLQDIISSHP